MRSNIFVAVFFYLIFCTQNGFMFYVPGPELKPGCRKFIGKVECQNGHGILPSAEVTVMESDFLDKISTAKIDRFGNYRIVGCTNKEFMVQPTHFYLQFENVCYIGQQERYGHSIPNEFEFFKLGLKGDEMATLVNNDTAAATSMPTKAKHHRRSKYPYPPQPRPRHRRQISDIGAGVEYGSGKFGPGCYKFVGQVQCQNGQILPSAKVAIMASDNIVMADDFLSIAKIDRFGIYQIIGCTNDGFMGQRQFAAVELYLEFEDVCFDGQQEQARNPKSNLFETHQLGTEDANDSPQKPIPRQDPQQPNVKQTPQPLLRQTPPPRSS